MLLCKRQINANARADAPPAYPRFGVLPSLARLPGLPRLARVIRLFRWLGRCVAWCLGCSLVAGAAWGASIRIGAPRSPLSLSFYIAEQQGFFADEGLDVVLVETASGAAAMTQLLAGQVQLASVADLPIMFRSFEGKPFRVVATIASSSQDNSLIVRKSSGIQSIKDFQGKHIAVAHGSTGQYYLDLVTLANGLDPRSVSQLNLDLQHIDQAAANPKIDAFAVWQPYASKLLTTLGREAFVLKVPSMYTVTFNLVALRGAGSLADDDMVKILHALDRAVGMIISNPQAAQAVLRDRLKLDIAAVDSLLSGYRFGLSLNQSLVVTLESTARWAIQEHLVPASVIPNFLDFIDTRPLTRLRPSAVTVAK